MAEVTETQCVVCPSPLPNLTLTLAYRLAKSSPPRRTCSRLPTRGSSRLFSTLVLRHRTGASSARWSASSVRPIIWSSLARSEDVSAPNGAASTSPTSCSSASGRPLEELFATFDPEPLATATIAQVRAGTAQTAR